ncbi:MAG: hypothetical protein NVS1B2_05830 [Vulcanimicrobiaceae bacterium]
MAHRSDGAARFVPGCLAKTLSLGGGRRSQCAVVAPEERSPRGPSPGAAASNDQRHRVRWDRTIAFGIVVAVAFFGITLWLAATLNIWQDEWYSLRTTSRDVRFAWATAIGFEGIPPLYPVVLDIWRHVNGSVLFARLLSIACVAGTAAIGASFARRHFAHVPPVAVAAVIAFNPFSIFAALEIRLYAMALVLSAAIIATFFAGFIDRNASPRARIAFAVVCIAGTYVQYFDGALVIGGGLALVAIGRLAALRAYAITATAIGFACLPIASFLKAQLGVSRSLDTHRVDIAGLLETFVSFVMPHGALPNWFSDRRNIVYDLALLTVVVAVMRARPHASVAVRALGSFVVVGMLFYPVATVVAHQTFFFPRHAVIVVVPALLFAFAILDSVARDRTRTMVAYLGAYAFATIAALWSTYHPLAKSGDFARAADFIRAHARPQVPVYAFDQEMVGPLRFYDRVDAIVPLPEPQRFDRFDAERFRFRSVDDVRAKMGPIAVGTHVLLYRGDVCYDRADQFGCRFLERVVRADFRTLVSRDLESANVRELIRR